MVICGNQDAEKRFRGAGVGEGGKAEGNATAILWVQAKSFCDAPAQHLSGPCLAQQITQVFLIGNPR